MELGAFAKRKSGAQVRLRMTHQPHVNFTLPYRLTITSGALSTSMEKRMTAYFNKLHCSKLTIGAAAIGFATLTGCVTTGAGTRSEPASQPAQAAAAKGPAPGMNANGEVVDSSKIGAGSGKTVKGLGDWEGEITGKPAANSKFTKLQIGMSMRQAVDLAGQPTDQGAYVTGKAWIPFYFGSDRHRYEMVFKGQGRLIFAGGSLGDFTGGNLIWIIHNATEGGYR
jgi:hypothetical protein